MTIDEVARYFNVSPSTVRRWIQSGKLEGQRVGVQWRFEQDAVRKAYEDGQLSGASQFTQRPARSTEKSDLPPEWAKAVLGYWGELLDGRMGQVKPDHVVVNDRRGAAVWGQIWALMPTQPYVWGVNLWHSLSVELMPTAELRQIFAGRRVLIFDEMMQRGREMHRLREDLSSAGANVTTLVCLRRRLCVIDGTCEEPEAICLEDADESLFEKRAAFLSHMLSLFNPPLDVDHLVVRGHIAAEHKLEDMVLALAKWGIPFTVWEPGPETGRFQAVTLDRPQFVDTSPLPNMVGFCVSWDGPCKIRFYVDPTTKICYCSFVVYPELSAPGGSWEMASLAAGYSRELNERVQSTRFSSRDMQIGVFRQVYWTICTDLAIRALSDFVSSGAAQDVGVEFGDVSEAIDTGQLCATHGPTRGNQVARLVGSVLKAAPQSHQLFVKLAPNPPSSSVRGGLVTDAYTDNAFDCRTALLKAIPFPDPQDDRGIQEQVTAKSYSQLFRSLPEYYESMIGRTLDYELDKGTIKPVVTVCLFASEVGDEVRVGRGFYRGEFGVWFEWDRSPLSFRDAAIQRTLGLGPAVVEQFLGKTSKSAIAATHFDKLFVNLQHDWSERFGLLYLGWKPYKYGPIPIVPERSAADEYRRFEDFLVDRACLVKVDGESHTRKGNAYRPADETLVPWHKLYGELLNGTERSHVRGLVQLYAAIQQRCPIERHLRPDVDDVSILRDPLVMLAAVRNHRVAYISAWYEVDAWRKAGDDLFPYLGAIALNDRKPPKGCLKSYLHGFAAPAILLFHKIEMYRNLPQLRGKIELLYEEFVACDALLATVDTEPKWGESEYPVGNLELAYPIMRAFTSFVRQTLTNCDLDVDTRAEGEQVDADGKRKDAIYYLGQLAKACPELSVMEHRLQDCVAESQIQRRLTPSIASVLTDAFHATVKILDFDHRIPDPRPSYERNRERQQREEGLIVVLGEVQYPGPYAVAVTDIRNVRRLASLWALSLSSYDDGLMGMTKLLGQAARQATKKHQNVRLAGITGDNAVLVGANVDDVLLATIDLVRATTDILKDYDRDQLRPFGLLRAGIAWHDQKRLGEYMGARPGLLAYALADETEQPAGAICVTNTIWEYLSENQKREFHPAVNGIRENMKGQGTVFVRQWDLIRDV